MITLQQDTIYMGTAAPASGGGGSGDAVWGSITGTLSNQTDLATALAGKQDTLTAGTGIDITNNVISVTGGGSSSYDDETINENASNELQAIGLKEARTDTAIRLWHGTEEQWEEGVSQTWYNWVDANATHSVDENAMLDSNNWGNVAYGDGKFVAVPGFVYNADVVAISADDGETWTSSSLPTGHSTRWNAIAYGDGHFVTLGYNSNAGAYSSDGGATWTDVTVPLDRWIAVAYGNGRFVAVSQINCNSMYSTDGGVTWSIGGSFAFESLQRMLVYGNGVFVTISGIEGDSQSTAYSTNGGVTWTAGTMSSSRTWMSATYGNGKFIVVAKGTDVFAYSSDGITWNEGTLPSSANWMSVTYGNGIFVAVTDNNKYAYSFDGGATWTEDSFTGTDWKSIAYGNDKFVAISRSTYLAAQITINLGSCFTSEANPTTASTVYSAPNTASALTITAVGTGTITLSDTNTYDYNARGNQTTYQSIGEAYPNYLCFINGVGVKMGTTSIVTVDQTYNASSTNAQSGVAVDSVVGNIETALQGV